MQWKSFGLALGLGALVAWAFAGCGGGSDRPDISKPGEAKQSKPAEHGEHEHGKHASEQENAADEVAANLNKLDPEDRKLAMAQKICPVSQDPLGEMGVPLKVTVKDETFFLCCKGCRKKLDADPDTYLARLAKIRAGEHE